MQLETVRKFSGTSRVAVRSYQRGWPIILVDGQWIYEDTGDPISIKRPCPCCKQMPTPEGFDACVGYVPKATSVCCGHGVEQPFTILEAPPCLF